MSSRSLSRSSRVVSSCAALGEGVLDLPDWLAWVLVAAGILAATCAVILSHQRVRRANAELRARSSELARELDERGRREDLILNVASGLSASTGACFFQNLVSYLARATGTCFAMVAAPQGGEGGGLFRTLAVFHDGRPRENFDYDPTGTPCEPVLRGELCICARNARKVYTICDQVSAHLQVESYVGAPLLDSGGKVLGLLAVAHGSPLEEPSEAASLLRIFSSRAAAELERQKDQRHQLDLEKQVLHAQKLESLGVLAGGIAHDFNNLLAAMQGNLNLAQALVAPEAPAQVHLASVEKLIQRTAELTGQMLAYAGKGRFVIRSLDLNHLLKDMANLLAVSIPKKVSLQYHLAVPLPAIQADAAQVQQVIMNLVTNASDAIQDKAGSIHLHTERVEADRRLLDQSLLGQHLQPGHYVALAVQDTGCGIPLDLQARIFEPFFTTKEKGRGLGLAATLGILRGHGAGLMIRSEVGAGTLFRLLFPASGEALPEPAPPRAPAAVPRALVLIVDDEEEVRNATRGLLRLIGLDTLVAVDGLDAVEQVLQNPAIDLVVLDLSMPRMDGREVFQHLQRVRPALPVILSSGFPEQDSLQGFLEGGLAGFLQKPYSLQVLREKVGAVLRSRAAGMG